MSESSSNMFTWNAGAIAGSALGASLWMPATAIVSGWSGVGIAISSFAALLILVAAYVLWRCRRRISAFRGLLNLLAIAFSAALLFFAAGQLLGLSVVDRWPNGKHAPVLSYAWVLLLYPAIAVWFWFLNRGRKMQRTG